MKYLKNINNRFNFFDIVMQSFVIFICLYLIDYFNLLGILLNNYRVIAISITLLITVYVFIEVIKNKLYKLIYIKTINYFDKLLFCCMFTNVFLIYNFITMHSYWKNLLFVSISINLIILLIRLIVISRSLNKATKKEVSVYSVYDLYKGKVKSKKLILLEEKEITTSDKDLLDISLFAKGIEDILLQCSPKETFIISLVGKWGSGKTSITNLVKEKINNSGNAVMETFNPWQYDDKYSLFKGFYNYLFRSLGENFGYVNYKETFQKYQNIIFGVVKKGFDISFDNIFERNSNKDIEEIKKSINN